MVLKKDQRPTGVTIIGILGFVSSGILALAAILFFVSAPLLSNFLNSFNATASIPGLNEITGIFVVIIGLILLILAIVELFVSFGIWRGQNWARIVTIVFMAIGFLSSLFTFPASIVTLVINGLIIWYLGFDEDAKSYFR
jgi:hypothetical protein